MLSFNGLPIHTVPVRIEPKIKTSPDFQWCSDEFRNKHDAWLVSMFGTRDLTMLKPGQIIKMTTDYDRREALYIRADELDRVKDAIARHNKESPWTSRFP